MEPLPNNLSLEEGVKIISYCPRCEASFDAKRALVVAEKEAPDPAHLLWIECGNCQLAVYAVVLINSIGMQSAGVVTDLSRDEIVRFWKAEPISADDVLDTVGMLAQDTFMDLIRQ